MRGTIPAAKLGIGPLKLDQRFLQAAGPAVEIGEVFGDTARLYAVGSILGVCVSLRLLQVLKRRLRLIHPEIEGGCIALHHRHRRRDLCLLIANGDRFFHGLAGSLCVLRRHLDLCQILEKRSEVEMVRGVRGTHRFNRLLCGTQGAGNVIQAVANPVESVGDRGQFERSGPRSLGNFEGLFGQRTGLFRMILMVVDLGQS
jgi:hypothetical protein